MVVIGGSLGGRRRDFMVGCPLAVAAVLSCKVQADRWIGPHLTQPVQRTPLWPASWLPSVDKSRVPSRLRSGRFGRFMMSVFSLCLVRMLSSWMSPLLQVMFLKHGLSGLGLLKLRMLMLINSVADPF